MSLRTIADLKKGETGIIQRFKDDFISLKLLEMGCVPNTEVALKHIAPLGDPVCIEVSGYKLSLRISEAQQVILK